MKLDELLAEVERLGKLDCDGRGMPCMTVSRDLARRLQLAVDALRQSARKASVISLDHGEAHLASEITSLINDALRMIEGSE